VVEAEGDYGIAEGDVFLYFPEILEDGHDEVDVAEELSREYIGGIKGRPGGVETGRRAGRL